MASAREVSCWEYVRQLGLLSLLKCKCGTRIQVFEKRERETRGFISLMAMTFVCRNETGRSGKVDFKLVQMSGSRIRRCFVGRLVRVNTYVETLS